MKNKSTFVLLFVVVMLFLMTAYITPPYAVYPRGGQPAVTPAPVEQHIARAPQVVIEQREAKPEDKPERAATVYTPPDDYDCIYFGICLPGQVPPTPEPPDDFDPDCFYFGVCDSGEIPPTPVPAETPVYP